MYFWLCRVFIAAWAFLQMQRAGATLQCVEWASHCGGFSCCRAQVLGHLGFGSCGSLALEHRLKSCDTWVQLLCGKWDLPASGVELVSSAWAGRFFTTEPPEKPYPLIFDLSLKAELLSSSYHLTKVASDSISGHIRRIPFCLSYLTSEQQWLFPWLFLYSVLLKIGIPDLFSPVTGSLSGPLSVTGVRRRASVEINL